MGAEMSKAGPEDTSGRERGGGDIGAAPSRQGMSPYATGGGGVTFERKVAVQYLAHLLVGDTANELGDDRRVVSIAFQQAPVHSPDDLVVSAARSDELQPSLVLTIAVRRSPNLVASDEKARELIRQFVRAVIDAPAVGPETRLGLVVAGSQRHAEQLAELADLAMVQMDAPGFFGLVRTPGKFDAAVRGRLDQLQNLVERTLHELGDVEVGAALVERRTWQFLSRLTVLMPRLESPDETDWSGVVNSLTRVVPDSDPAAALGLRDRLVDRANEYSPSAARVNLTMLRRDSHALLDPTTRRHRHGWQTLDRIHQLARESVRAEITAGDGGRSVRLERSGAAMELLKAVSSVDAVVVSGESGVGKSALAVLGLTAAGDAGPDSLQALCINLRQIPKLAIELEATLGCPFSTLLCELSAPQRILVVDGADAAAEDRLDAFRCLVGAARESAVRVIAVTSVDGKQVVLDALSECFDGGVAEHVVSPLGDSEIDDIVGTFSELERLNANPRSRELLRRLVLVDLLVRGQVSGTPLTDADAMNEVWSGLVRRCEMSDRGFPDARETALLRLAELELGEGKRLDVISRIDPAALDGLRRDGLLRTSPEAPFQIGPEFSHDEVRRYAVARLFLAGDSPTSRLLRVGAPRWSLAAARLACQEWLGRLGTSIAPLSGRFVALQASFGALVAAGHGSRWGDVPGEALLALADPEALLRDAWPELLADGAAGLRRLARLVDQRLRGRTGVVDVIAVEPIIALLLEDRAPWRSGDCARDLLREWLRGHVVANTGAGHRLRILLRERLVDACAAADRRLAEEREAANAARAARTPEEIEQERQRLERHSVLFSEFGYDGRRPQQRPEVPREIKDKDLLELLALLGPDLGDDGAAILRRVAKDAPSRLAPAVEELFTGRALASGRRGLLAELTEAYYLDDDVDRFGFHAEGVRRHHARSVGVVPQAAWYRGPFMSLFQSDFRDGVGMLNRLLNHAARIRVGKLARLDRGDRRLVSDPPSPYESELDIAGTRRHYVGDEHVWRWCRGTGVGPYPCLSALQALERVCDQMIEIGAPIRNLVAILLDGCENLAMVGLIVGLLVRYLERASNLLDPYVTEPLIWHYEFARVVNEASGLTAGSEGLVAPERRNWSLREAAMFMVVRADGERAAELRTLGETLVANARRLVGQEHEHRPSDVGSGTEFAEQYLVKVRAWASSLERDRYEVHKTQDGFSVQATPPDDVAQALHGRHEDLELATEATRLFVRYYIDPTKESAEPIGHDELAVDMATARKLLDNPQSQGVYGPWDTSALVAAAALEAHLLDGADLPEEALSFAAELVLRIGEGEAWPRQFEFEGTFFEQGADRTAARVLPLLLLPGAAKLRVVLDEEDGWTAFERAIRSGVNLARAVADEVRLHLARGLDHVWKTSCVKDGHCHHDLGWRIATETIRFCVRGDWDPELGRCSVLPLEEPVTESIAGVDDDSIIVSRLDAAIRALAPVAMADVCVSAQARDLLLALLAAQRRSLLACEPDGDPDSRGSHTLVSARALLTLARDGNDAAIFEHLDAYADNSPLLGNLLRALSAAAEEAPDRAATARRIWPEVVRHILQLNQSGHTPFRDAYYGDMTLAALIPSATGELPYLYREVDGSPITWWDPVELVPEVEAWLVPAAGNAICINQPHQLRKRIWTGRPSSFGPAMDRGTCGSGSHPHRPRHIRTDNMADRNAICRYRCRALGHLAANRR